MDLPRISIVTPSYNQGLYLEACIKSVLDQDYPNLEYIVLDGGSTDLSKYILNKYSDCFSFWRSSPDKGQYHAIQEGLDLATGDILAWLNSDDMLHPGALWIIAETFKNHPESLWFTGIPTKWNTSGELTYINPSSPDWSYEYFRTLLDQELKLFLQQESTFFTRRIWELSGSRIDTQYRLAADFELWLRFSRHVSVHKVDALIGGFREHGDQKTANHYQTYLNEVREILEKDKQISPQPEVSVRRLSIASKTNEFAIATSLAPKDLVNQSKAIATWLDNGYAVHSFNSREEIQTLTSLFPQVVFHEVTETAAAITGKPMVFLSDIFSYFHANRRPFTLINSDIFFSVSRGIAQRLAVEHERNIPSIILASRIEIENEFTQLTAVDPHNAITRLKYGRHYFMGFDFFSMNLPALEIITQALMQKSRNRYGLGIPWWDHWLPMIALRNNIKLSYLVPSPIIHFHHEAQYSKNLWRDYGCNWCLEFGLIDELQLAAIKSDTEKLDLYLSNICAQTIRTLGASFAELDLGALVRAPKGGCFEGKWYDFVCQEHYHFAWYNYQEQIGDALSRKSHEVENIERALFELAGKG